MARRFIGGVLAMVLGACAFPAAPQPAPATAGDAAPSGAKLDLARQLVEASGVEAALSASFRDVVGQTYASLKPASSTEAQARRRVFADAQADAMAKITPKIVASLVDN